MHSFACSSESSNIQEDEGELLVAIATLVTEGRIPGPSDSGSTKPKDFHEGPHCNNITGNSQAHKCVIDNPLCEKFKQIRRSIRKFFKKGVPFCIEVLFTCACKEHCNIDNLDNAILLEQWYFCTNPSRSTSSISFNINQLISAIRSQLYFSQITAWLVTQDKSSPIKSANLKYRLSTPEELLAPLAFSLTASKHEFPRTDLGCGTALSISFLSAPRLSTKPAFDCTLCFSKKTTPNTSDKMEIKNKILDDRMHTSCTLKGKHCCEEMEDNDHGKDINECSNICQRYNMNCDLRSASNLEITKCSHNNGSPEDLSKPCDPPSGFAKQNEEVKMDFERYTWSPGEFHNDLKTVQDKGKLLLDAIERSGRNSLFSNNVYHAKTQHWPTQGESDNFNCDMSESDKLFSHRGKRNNFNIYVDNNCDSNILARPTKKMRDVSNVNITSKSTGARKKITFGEEPVSEIPPEEYNTNGRCIPIIQDQSKIRRNLGNTTSTAFHARTGLPLSSSPAPARKGKSRFDFDSSLNSVSAIKSALFSSSFSADEESETEGSIISPCSPELYTAPKTELYPVIYRQKGRPTGLLGTFEESVLNGRLEPVSTVHGFRAELGASGSFVPKHIFVPVTAFFYAFGDHDRVSTPYLGHIGLGRKGYNIPKVGTVQVTLFNPLGTVVKMFVLPYDLSDMPPNSQTFMRQRTLYMPTEYQNKEFEHLPKWLRFLIHVRFMSSKSGKVYLHSDIRMIIMRKSDMDTATAHDLDMNYELRSFIHMPTNPRFSPRK